MCIKDSLYTASYNSTLYLFTTMCYALCIAAVPILTKEFAADRKRGEKAANNLLTITLLGSLAAVVLWLSLIHIFQDAGREQGARRHGACR